jgi:hypothetical protein
VTEQPASRTMAGDVAGDVGAHGLDAQVGPPAEHEAHHGRPASWAVTTIVVIGFIIGGIGLCIGPSWVLFWVGAGIVVLAGIMGAAVHIFDDWY